MDKKLVVVTGAASFLGVHLIKKLKSLHGFRIICLSRSIGKCLELEEFRSGVEVKECDLLKKGSLEAFLEKDCVVINLAYKRDAGLNTNLDIVNNVIQSCNNAKVKRLIHCSTADVVGRSNVNPVSERTPCAPVTDYAKTKLNLERVILSISKKEFEAVVIRPTAVFGIGGKNLIKIIDYIVNGNRVINYLKSCLYYKRRMNLVYVDNVVAAFIYLISYVNNIDGEIFNISDDQCQSNNYLDVESILMEKLNITRIYLFHLRIPPVFLTYLLTLIGRDNVNPERIFSIEKLTNSGFKSPVTFEEGLSLYSDWYRLEYLSN